MQSTSDEFASCWRSDLDLGGSEHCGGVLEAGVVKQRVGVGVVKRVRGIGFELLWRLHLKGVGCARGGGDEMFSSYKRF